MQGNVFGDMEFRDRRPQRRLSLPERVGARGREKTTLPPVMVWIYGGGYAAGATTKARQDGEMLAKKGVVVVSMNYRLGVFGFLAHPGLAKESGHVGRAITVCWIKRRRLSGFRTTSNRLAAIQRTSPSLANRRDRFRSSGSMASPKAKGLFQKAIGESGAFFGSSLAVVPVSEAQLKGAQFAASRGSVLD